VQVDPVKPKLKPHGTKRLKLKYDKPLSKFAFKFNLHHYNKVKDANGTVAILKGGMEKALQGVAR
jgi:hypothetical protein